MPEPQNIKEFKRMVGLVLGKLYATHPHAQFFDEEGFLGELAINGDEVSLLNHTIGYLVENGYIHQDKQFHLRLNAQSWDILEQPNPLDRSTTLGASLSDWAANAASIVTTDTLRKAVDTSLELIAVRLGLVPG